MTGAAGGVDVDERSVSLVRDERTKPPPLPAANVVAAGVETGADAAGVPVAAAGPGAEASSSALLLNRKIAIITAMMQSGTAMSSTVRSGNPPLTGCVTGSGAGAGAVDGQACGIP